MDWHFVEGFSKWLLFLSFWFLTPVLPRSAVRLMAYPVGYLTVLYALALLTVTVNLMLPAGSKILPPPQPAQKLAANEHLSDWEAVRNQIPGETVGASGTVPRLTKDPLITGIAAQPDNWTSLRTVIGGLLTLTAWGVLHLLHAVIQDHAAEPPPAIDNLAAIARAAERQLIGASLFFVGAILDFAKWWFDVPGK